MYKPLHAAVGGEAAVDGQDDAGDEAGCLVVQKEQQESLEATSKTRCTEICHNL